MNELLARAFSKKTFFKALIFVTIKICFFSAQFNPAKIYVNRYLRYFPAVAILILIFSSSLPQYLADGFNYQDMPHNAMKCKKWWWSSLMFMQNYKNLKETCLDHTWYLSVDFQLFLITPFVVCLLRKYGRRFLTSLVVLIFGLQFMTFYDLNE